MTRVLLADDEPALTRRLIRLLKIVWEPDRLGTLELDDPVTDGAAALQALRESPPDLAFLDIRMPGPSGIDVARALIAESVDAPGSPIPIIVFVTAYDDHAVDAFEAAAADYLLKPVEEERLRRCLQRISTRLPKPKGTDAVPADNLIQLSALLEKLTPQQTGTDLLRWLRVGRGDEVELVPIEDVVYFRSEHKYTTAVTADREHLLRRPLKDLLTELDPDQFWQIHRGTVVNVSDIQRAERDLRGRYEVTLKRRRETLRASQSFSHRFKKM